MIKNEYLPDYDDNPIQINQIEVEFGENKNIKDKSGRFIPFIKEKLEESFNKNFDLTIDESQRLENELGLTNKQIHQWFISRLQKSSRLQKLNRLQKSGQIKLEQGNISIALL